MGDEDRGAPSVVVIDDQRDLVLLLERLLSRNGFSVAGTAHDGEAGIDVVSSTQPDVVLLDLRMPGLDGGSALPAIIRESPETMVAVLSAHLGSDIVEPLLRHGAFAAYDKGDLARLPEMLAEDLERFRKVLDGQDDLPAWRHRYRRL